MNVALYARVSSRDKGQDTENQISAMKSWAAQQSHTVAAVYQDQASGSGKQKRPAFEAMLADAAAGKWETLLFWSLDRLSREGVYETLRYLRRLDEAGVAWRSHTEAYLDSCGVFREAVLAILAAVAKQERLRISERVMAGLEVARVKGAQGQMSKSGKRLAGHGGRPVAVVDTEAVERARRLRAEGLSVSQVAAEMGLSKSSAHRLMGRAA